MTTIRQHTTRALIVDLHVLYVVYLFLLIG